jgi:phosphorylcholine metabolism protein LicD
MKRGGQKVDIFFYKKEGDKAIIPLYSQNTKNIVAPAHFYEELGDISFYGMDFKCPLDIDNYLKAQYGDWETKINRKNFDYSNPEHHKLLV